MEPSFARVSTPGGLDVFNPRSVWAAKQSFDVARRQGATLVHIIDRAESAARSLPRMWSPTPGRAGRGGLDVRG